jgi:hypothetical protein
MGSTSHLFLFELVLMNRIYLVIISRNFFSAISQSFYFFNGVNNRYYINEYCEKSLFDFGQGPGQASYYP